MALISYWYCHRCKEIIPRDELRIVREEERHYWLDDSPVEVSYNVFCPYCGSEEIDETDYCDVCGSPCIPDDLEDGICKECREKEK